MTEADQQQGWPPEPCSQRQSTSTSMTKSERPGSPSSRCLPEFGIVLLQHLNHGSVPPCDGMLQRCVAPPVNSRSQISQPQPSHCLLPGGLLEPTCSGLTNAMWT